MPISRFQYIPGYRLPSRIITFGLVGFKSQGYASILVLISYVVSTRHATAFPQNVDMCFTGYANDNAVNGKTPGERDVATTNARCHDRLFGYSAWIKSSLLAGYCGAVSAFYQQSSVLQTLIQRMQPTIVQGGLHYKLSARATSHLRTNSVRKQLQCLEYIATSNIAAYQSNSCSNTPVDY